MKTAVAEPRVLSASTLAGDPVSNSEGEKLGKIEDFMIDLDSGRIAYAVLSFGGFLGVADKLFAIPWEALRLDTESHEFVLNVNKRALQNAPGFDKDRQDVQSLAAAGFIDEATLRERYATEYRPNLAAGAEKQDLTMQLWVEMCWPRNLSR